MDDALVGGCSKPKESHWIIWHNCCMFIHYTFNTYQVMIKVVLPVFLFLIVWVCCSNTTIRIKPAEEQQKNDLPALDLQMRDGSKISAKNLPGKVALILFFPDCDHCQREAAQIQKNIAGFKDYTLYFISSAPFEEINHFATTYQLHNYKNVVFARTEAQNVINAFGPIETPTIYLYDKSGKLIETFSGEVAIEVVLKYI
jgi:peroxiredoxin